MTFRLPAVLVGAAALVGLTACGSEAGTGASSQSTRVEISQPVYVTAPPVTTAATIAGQDQTVGGIVNEEQQYTVVFGDYLIGIAKKHCISLDTLVAYNNWPEGNKKAVNPNDVVRIPSGSCAPGTDLSAAATGSGQTGQTGGATAPTPSSAAPTTEYTGPTYTVVDGDFLIRIANKTKTTVEALMAANGWTGDPSAVSLYKGQKIKLPAETG